MKIEITAHCLLINKIADVNHVQNIVEQTSMVGSIPRPVSRVGKPVFTKDLTLLFFTANVGNYANLIINTLKEHNYNARWVGDTEAQKVIENKDIYA